MVNQTVCWAFSWHKITKTPPTTCIGCCWIWDSRRQQFQNERYRALSQYLWLHWDTSNTLEIPPVVCFDSKQIKNKSVQIFSDYHLRINSTETTWQCLQIFYSLLFACYSRKPVNWKTKRKTFNFDYWNYRRAQRIRVLWCMPVALWFSTVWNTPHRCAGPLHCVLWLIHPKWKALFLAWQCGQCRNAFFFFFCHSVEDGLVTAERNVVPRWPFVTACPRCEGWSNH